VKVAPRHPDPLLPSLADYSIDPSRLRLRRVATSWSAGEQPSSLLASLTVLDHGGYAAPIVTGGKKHLTVRLSSRKTGERQMLEGPSELFLGMDSEVRWDVRDWQAHPIVFEFVYNGRPLVYHLDLMRQLRDGSIDCIEAKRTPRDLRDPDYRTKLACVAEICRRVGWRFLIHYKAEIRGCITRIRNVEALFGRTYQHVERRQEDAVRRFEQDGAPLEWGTLRDRISPAYKILGNAVIHHMITRARIAADLDRPFCPEAAIRPLGPAPAVPSMRI
jgi:hypothetical protein